MNFKTVAKIIFFIQPTLRCIGGLQYKVYPWASFLCFSAHKRGNAPDFYPVPCRHQTTSTSSLPACRHPVLAEQIRLLAHHHVTNQPFSIRVVYRLVLNLEHSPLYRHFCKCLYIELLGFRLFFNYYIHFLCSTI